MNNNITPTALPPTDPSVPPHPPILQKPPPFHPYFQKLFMPFLAILVLVTGLGIGLNLIRSPQSTSTSASTNLVDLSLSPSASTISPNQTTNVNIIINTQSYKVTVTELHLAYPGDKLEGVSITAGDFLPVILTAGSIGPGTASITLGSGTSGYQGSGVAAILTLKAKATGSATISFDSTQIAGIDANGNPVPTNILGDANPTTLTISEASAAGEPNSCGGTCGSNYNCKADLFCYQGFCRNPLCKTTASCICSSPTPTPTPTTRYPQPTPETVVWTPEPYTPTDTPTPTPTLIPLPTEEPSSPQFPWLPIAGISAAVIGLVIFLIRKFRRPPLDIPPVSPPQST